MSSRGKRSRFRPPLEGGTITEDAPCMDALAMDALDSDPPCIVACRFMSRRLPVLFAGRLEHGPDAILEVVAGHGFELAVVSQGNAARLLADDNEQGVGLLAHAQRRP